jgi:hypothetical protein
VASRPVNTWRSRSSPPPDKWQVRAAPSPYPPDWSWWSVKGRQTLVSLVHLPVSLTGPASSGSTDASRRCQGCSHPPRRLPDQAAPSFTQPLRRLGSEGLSPPLDFGRLVAHVRLGPVVSHEQQLVSRPRRRSPCAAHGRTISDLMNQCSRHSQRARHPISDQLSRPTGRGTISVQDSTPRTDKCSPAGGYQTRVCPMDDSLTLIRHGPT